MIHWRICKRCNEPFDIDTSKELCPKCREGEDEKR
jgi:Zn finger protein HypA/HybF involved in hydrogenase expression